MYSKVDDLKAKLKLVQVKEVRKPFGFGELYYKVLQNLQRSLKRMKPLLVPGKDQYMASVSSEQLGIQILETCHSTEP